jgi:hypothetical protein
MTLTSMVALASILFLPVSARAAKLDAADCRENLYRQGYLNQVNDNCPPEFTDIREDFTLALQAEGYPCNQMLGPEASSQFDRGETV